MRQRRQGLWKPDRLYVMKTTAGADNQTSENGTSGYPVFGVPEVPKEERIKNDINNICMSDTDLIYPSRQEVQEPQYDGMECMHRNTTPVRNMRSYLLTALYNAPAAIDSYYAGQVAQHEIA